MSGELRVVDARDRREREACAYAAVRELLAHGRCVAWIVPTRDIVLALKRRLADTGAGLLGVEIATLEDWARGRWALYGDDRTWIGGLQRKLLAKRVLDQGKWKCPSLHSTGMADSLADIVRAGAGLAAFEGWEAGNATGDGRTELTSAQRELMDACKGYFELVQAQDLIEPGSTMHELTARMPEAGWQHLVVDGCWSLEGAAIELVAQACGHAGATLVGCLGANAACEAEKQVVRQIKEVAGALGVKASHIGGAEFLARTPQAGQEGEPAVPVAGPSPARSPELVALTDALFGEGTASPITPTGALRACLPAGHYAEGELLARQIGQLTDADDIAPRDIAVVTRRPMELAQALAGPLSEHAPRGIALAVSSTEKIAHSHAGAFALAWARLLEATQSNPDAPAPDLRTLASDLARNPYMRTPTSMTFKLDRTWRRNRMTSARDYVRDLVAQLEVQHKGTDAACAGASEMGTPDEEAPRNAPSPNAPRDLAWVLDMLAARAPQPTSPDDAFERACIASIARGVSEWRSLMGAGPDSDALAWLLDTLSVPQGWVSVPSSDIAAQQQARALQASPNAVRVVGMGEMDALETRATVLCDLTADTYPLRERVDVKSTLWQALGLSAGTGQIAQLRRMFHTAIEATGDIVVVERVLADEEAKPLRPCALLEELVDCYRADPSCLDDLDRTTGLPTSGIIPCMGLGEEKFAQLASIITYAPALVSCRPPVFELADPSLASLLAKPDATWSPSSLEALINCPMRWLHERKLPSDSLDIPFGDPRSRGTFCHLVLERFHDLLGERTGIARIMAETPRQVWEDVLNESFEYACGAQLEAERPLIPITELEKARLRGYRNDLVKCLEREQYMPEGFVPARNEWEFGQEDGTPVTLGGIRIRGVIDRIDINEEKQAALVVDYKGGLQAGHGPVLPKTRRGAEDDSPVALDPLPRHSQIIMYMAALCQTEPALNLAGGLYVSYKKPACAGFLDMRQVGFIGDDKTAYLQRKTCVPLDGPDGTPGIEVVMARVEEAVKEAVAPLREGRVIASPRFGKDSCSFCPLAGSCPKEAK